MLIEGKFTLKAPIQQTWDFLLKPETLAACVPGAEKVELVDDRTFDCLVAASVGAIKVKFQFRVILTEIDPPSHLKAEGSGEEVNKRGTFTMQLTVDLKELPEENVEVYYRTDVNIVGNLATFGDRIMKAKARQVGVEFADALSRKLSGEEVVPSTGLKMGAGEVAASIAALPAEKLKNVFKRK